jgi:hypothetical protein
MHYGLCVLAGALQQGDKSPARLLVLTIADQLRLVGRLSLLHHRQTLKRHATVEVHVRGARVQVEDALEVGQGTLRFAQLHQAAACAQLGIHVIAINDNGATEELKSGFGLPGASQGQTKSALCGSIPWALLGQKLKFGQGRNGIGLHSQSRQF